MGEEGETSELNRKVREKGKNSGCWRYVIPMDWDTHTGWGRWMVSVINRRGEWGAKRDRRMALRGVNRKRMRTKGRKKLQDRHTLLNLQASNFNAFISPFCHTFRDFVKLRMPQFILQGNVSNYRSRKHAHRQTHVKELSWYLSYLERISTLIDGKGRRGGMKKNHNHRNGDK